MAVRAHSILIFLGIAGVSMAGAAPGGAGDWVLPNFAQRLEVEVANPGAVPVNALITLPVEDAERIAPSFPGSLAVAMIVNAPGETPAFRVVPSQADDLDGDGTPDQFEFPISLGPGEQRSVHVYYSTTLRSRIVYPRRVHAAHDYGFNHQTATLESERIGYRTYGGFFLDVQARTEGRHGLFNDLVGFLPAGRDFENGKDIFHIGDTLGLGGLFVRRKGQVFRPPLNMPDYAHKPSPPGVPRYRIVADGPLRAIFEATLDPWKVGGDELRLRATYTMDADSEFVRCRFWLVPLQVAPGHEYEIGAGLRELPAGQLNHGRGRLMLAGEQTPKLGRFALALFYDPAQAAQSDPVRTPEGLNQAVLFRGRLRPGEAVQGSYSMAAAWSGSGIKDLFKHLEGVQPAAEAKVTARNFRFRRTPHPERVEGEAN